MKRRFFLLNLYLTNRLFYALSAIALIFVSGFFLTLLYYIALTLLIFITAVFVTEVILLFQPAVKFSGKRSTPKIFSLGDENYVQLQVVNSHSFTFRIKLIDEVPEQFQWRNFHFYFILKGKETRNLTYNLRPLTRGIFRFGNINLMISTPIGLCRRRIILPTEGDVNVYPSVIQMKKYELIALARISTQEGIKRLRRLGHSYEFEEIKEYVRGDDYRSINWKASGRRNALMVNQYEDERAQQIYTVIDRSRSMRMPFNGLSLLDYSVNTSLVISNIALLKSDKAGLLTFADKIQSFIKADRNRRQLSRIMEALYAQREEPLEANYELLFQAARNYMQGRSLVFLYTNFESGYALERVLPILRRINHLHLLVVVFFQNTEIEDYTRQTVHELEDIYTQTIAQKFVTEKAQLVTELRRHGIQSILTRPEDLSINTVNKYLEFKARGWI